MAVTHEQYNNKLIRPDRQITYPGIPYKDWPPPPTDSDTICMNCPADRPPHRFIIKKGDTVDVDISSPGTPVIWRGIVCAIDRNHPEKKKVKVSFPDKNHIDWFTLGVISPVAES